MDDEKREVVGFLHDVAKNPKGYATAEEWLADANQRSAEYRAVDYAWLAVSVSDIKKKSFSPTNQSWQSALIVDPLPELAIMGRRGTLGKAHWFAIYLDAGKSVEANLTAGDATSNFDLVGYDSNGKTVLVSSKNGGGAKETAASLGRRHRG